MARARSRKSPAVLPLKNRLPNPPAVFVGRDGEVEWLRDAIGRAPVTVVAGPGGVGKTALVLHTLHEHFPRRIDSTIWLDVPPGQPSHQLRQEILRALAGATERPLDWAGLQSDPERTTTTTLSLAEEGPFWFVIDDIFQDDVEMTRELLVQLATYARKARFIATSRMDPRLPELASQVLPLGAMRDDELLRLAGAWAPDVDATAARRCLGAAAGSPWLLHQLLLSGSTGDVGERELLEGLPPAAAELLRTLAVLELPLSLDVLSAVLTAPTAEELSALERRGLIHRSAGGVRLHDVARGILEPRVERERRLRVATALAEAEPVEAILEAGRLFLAVSEIDSLGALLDARAADIITRGYAPQLWRFIRDVDEPRVLRWRLRCAAELGNPTALAFVGQASPRDADDRLAWARTLLAQGEIDAAEEQARDVLEVVRNSGDGGRILEAALLVAACCRYRGDLAAAGSVLESVSANDPGQALRRDAARILYVALASDGPEPEGLHSLTRATALLAQHQEAAHELALALYAMGRTAEASDVLGAVQRTPRGSTAALLPARQAMLLRARLALDDGDLATVEELVEEVRPFARGSSLLRPQLLVTDAARRLLAGELSGLADVLRAAVAEVGEVDVLADIELASIATRLAIVTGDAPAIESAADRRSSLAAAELSLWNAIRVARTTGTMPDDVVLTGRRRHAILGHLLRASLLCADGAGDDAIAEANEAVREARRWGIRTAETEAQAALVEALVCAGRLTDVADAAESLIAIGDATGSARFVSEGELYRSFAAESVQPALLERTACLVDVAPVAARRAQALLGGQPFLDHVDLRVLEVLVSSTDCGQVSRLDGPDAPEWESGWGLDHPRRTVWFPDGRQLDLSATPLLFRILDVLSSHGGAASKEQLIVEAWGEREYHPLRHDGRLHAAVRKLRKQLEDDAAAPERLLTTDDGYCLGGPVRELR